MRRMIFLALTNALLTVDAKAADCAVRTLSCGAAQVSESISAADCSASDGTGYDVWEFSGSAGETVTLTMHSDALDSFLVLIDPLDRPIAQNDDRAAATSDAAITITLPSSGTYSVIANTVSSGATGAYTLSLNCGTASGRRRSVRRG